MNSLFNQCNYMNDPTPKSNIPHTTYNTKTHHLLVMNLYIQTLFKVGLACPQCSVNFCLKTFHYIYIMHSVVDTCTCIYIYIYIYKFNFHVIFSIKLDNYFVTVVSNTITLKQVSYNYSTS